MAFADKQITCRDCGNTFVFTGGEQEFYANKGLMNEPTRCPSCRSARRASQSTLQENDGYVRYGNFASFGGKTPRQMHPAACAESARVLGSKIPPVTMLWRNDGGPVAPLPSRASRRAR